MSLLGEGVLCPWFHPRPRVLFVDVPLVAVASFIIILYDSLLVFPAHRCRPHLWGHGLYDRTSMSICCMSKWGLDGERTGLSETLNFASTSKAYRLTFGKFYNLSEPLYLCHGDNTYLELVRTKRERIKKTYYPSTQCSGKNTTWPFWSTYHTAFTASSINSCNLCLIT